MSIPRSISGAALLVALAAGPAVAGTSLQSPLGSAAPSRDGGFKGLRIRHILPFSVDELC